jgi:ferredoxin
MEWIMSATYSIADGCLRCGACSSLAPGLIAMGDTAAVVVRQPATAAEIAATEAALFNCPMHAIRKRAASGTAPGKDASR